MGCEEDVLVSEGVLAESLPQVSKTPTKMGVFSATRMMSANWRFRVLSSAPVCFLLFSDSASAMTLAMTLAPNVSRVRLVGNHAGKTSPIPRFGKHQALIGN